jgi:hypothetical protein
MSTLEAVRLEDTVFGELKAQNRLLDAVLMETLPRPSLFGYRGDIALAFQEQLADEARPPAYSLEQVLAASNVETGKIPVLVGYLHNFAWLTEAAEVLADYLVPDGKYIFFVNNIDFLKMYTVTLPGGIAAYVLPLDESTVWKETLELVGVDKNDMKKLGGADKLAYVLDRVVAFKAKYPELSYEDGIATMAPVRNRNENRPV